MGLEIVYCSICQTRLLEKEFAKRKAFWIDHRACCKKCIPRLLAPLSPEQQAAARAEMDRPLVEEKKPLATTPRKGTEIRLAPPLPPTPPPQISLLRILAGVGAGLVLLFAILFVASPEDSPVRRLRPEPPDETPPPVAVQPRRTPETLPPTRTREEKAAALAARKARDFLKAEPDKIDEALQLFEDAVWETRNTSLFEDLKKEFEALQKTQSERLQKELTPVLDEMQAARSREEYARALDLLKKAVARHPWKDWAESLQRQIRETRAEVDKFYAAVRDKAVQAKRRADDTTVAGAVERVRHWGLADLSADLDRALASIKATPAISPHAKAWHVAWEKAVRVTWGRNYADAIRDIEAEIKGIKDAPLQAEAGADLEAIRAASQVPAEAIQILSRTPASQKLTLEVEDAAGNPLKVEGALVRSDPAGLELKTEAGSTRVDFSDLTADALVELFRARPNRNADADARAIQVFLVLEGEDLPAQTPDPALARLVAEARIHAGAAGKEKEAVARALHARAEKEFEDFETKLDAAEKFATLLSKHGDTRHVLRRRAEIAARIEATKESGKEYIFFPGQMRAAGQFQLVTHKKGEIARTLQSDQTLIKDHYVDLVFAALPDLEYKGWALLGGCCAETFTHSLQGSEMSMLAEKSGEKISAETGGPGLIPGKMPSVFLKKLHAMHGGPKAPSRWEWVPLALPKYAAGGRKVVRICSGQQGFSVRAAVISSTRTATLGDAEFKEIEKARTSMLQKPAPAFDGTLVGHWKFDEGSGAMAADCSGSGMNGTVKNGAAWTQGRIGGALAFNGTNQIVEVGASPKLYFKGPFSIALWVNAGDIGNNKWRYFLGDYSQKGDVSSFALRASKTGTAEFFWEYPAGVWAAAQSKSQIPVGKWVHLAGTWDGTTRRIYLNGLLEGADATPQQRPPSMYSMAIGRGGGFNGFYMLGEIDDVRLYSRTLADSEILQLVRSAPRK